MLTGEYWDVLLTVLNMSSEAIIIMGKDYVQNVLLTTSFERHTGGLTSYLNSLEQALTIRNIKVTTLFNQLPTRSQKFKAVLKGLGVRDRARVELTKIRTGSYKKNLHDILKERTFEIIHCQDVISASLFVREPGKIVLTVHGPLSRELAMMYPSSQRYIDYIRAIEKKAYQRADQIIAVDQGQKEIIALEYKINPQKIEVLLNAVDTGLFDPTKANQRGKEDYLLVPRRLVPKNGVAVAIKSMAALRELNLELWVAGDGIEKDMLTKLTKELGIRHRVKFLGNRPHAELTGLVQNAKAVLIPSVPVFGVVEASSIAALEGMAAGKPVIASDIGGLAQLIKHAETGFLFKPGDAEALAEIIRTIDRDPELAGRVGARASREVEEKYSTKIWVDKVLGVYTRTLNK